MNIAPFKLERYFAKHEFSARYLLSSSDCEPLAMGDLLGLADEECRTLWDALVLGYTESAGNELLRAEIAKLYPGLSADDILLVAPQEGIFLAMHALLRPGDEVACTMPAYQSLYAIAQSLGCPVTPWMPREDQGWRFALADLGAQVSPHTRLWVVNFPHNPTGWLPDRDEFHELVGQAKARGTYLFSDEMYRFLERAPRFTLPAACSIYERAVSLGGLSKSFGLPGLRIGWLATRDQELLGAMQKLRDYTTICSSAPSEILAIMALRSRDAILAPQRQRIARNLDVLDEFFARHPDLFAWQRPPGASVGLARLLGREAADEFCAEVLATAEIMLAPSSLFEFGSRHVRIGYGRENLPRVIDALSRYLGSRAV